MSKQKVIIGLSGGVDSSVSAFLLQQEGYEVEGLFMKNWEQDDYPGHCAAADDLKDASSSITLEINSTQGLMASLAMKI